MAEDRVGCESQVPGAPIPMLSGCLGVHPETINHFEPLVEAVRLQVKERIWPPQGAVPGCNPHRRPPASMGWAGGRRKRENLRQLNPALKSSLILSFLRTPELQGWRVGAGGCHPSWLKQLQPSAVLVSSKVQFLQVGCPRVGFLLLRGRPRSGEGVMQVSGQKDGGYVT